MQYSVIVENKNNNWRAFIPALADLAAEGTSKDEAINNAKKAAEDYLSSVEVTTIEVNLPNEAELRPDSPQAWLRDAGAFVGDEEAMREHIEEIYAERRRQREAAELEETLTDTDESAA